MLELLPSNPVPQFEDPQFQPIEKENAMKRSAANLFAIALIFALIVSFLPAHRSSTHIAMDF